MPSKPHSPNADDFNLHAWVDESMRAAQLDNLGVAHVWLEARHPALNERDLRLVKALRGKRSISPSIRVEFARPKDEPMLWIPDAVAGAVNGAQ